MKQDTLPLTVAVALACAEARGVAQRMMSNSTRDVAAGDAAHWRLQGAECGETPPSIGQCVNAGGTLDFYPPVWCESEARTRSTRTRTDTDRNLLVKKKLDFVFRKQQISVGIIQTGRDTYQNKMIIFTYLFIFGLSLWLDTNSSASHPFISSPRWNLSLT